jgi:hypothetical protein
MKYCTLRNPIWNLLQFIETRWRPQAVPAGVAFSHCEHSNKLNGSIKGVEFLGQLGDYQPLKCSAPWSQFLYVLHALLGYFLPIPVYLRRSIAAPDCLTVLYTGDGPLCWYCIPCPRLITWDDNRMEAWLTQCCNAQCGVRCAFYRVPSNSTVSGQLYPEAWGDRSKFCKEGHLCRARLITVILRWWV